LPDIKKLKIMTGLDKNGNNRNHRLSNYRTNSICAGVKQYVN
jgi:hypothetical protein